MNDDQADTVKFRRETRKRGPYGTNWYLYSNGVPPEDDENDYEWNGSFWSKVWED